MVRYKHTIMHSYFKFHRARKVMGVCRVYSLEPDMMPRKVKISVRTHRFGCRLGLCSTTTLVTFRFEKPEYKSFADNEKRWQEVRRLGYHRWTSR